MRRKTTAKRILYNSCEAAGEPTQYEAAEHRPSESRRELHPIKDKGEKLSPCDAAPLKLIEKQTFEVDDTEGQTLGNGDFTMEVLGNLQTCSRAELIAMVLTIQREADSLREQIKTLTAYGKLAQRLEDLGIKSEGWWNFCSVNMTQSFPTTQEINIAPSPVPTPKVQSEMMIEQQGYSQQGRGHEINENTQRSDTPSYQEFIPAELLERCNTGTTAQKLTNELLRSLYDRDCLASHSISGVVSSRRSQPKPALPAHEIQAILRAVQHYFPGKTDSEIKGYIRQKLQNEAKRLRKRPHLSLESMAGL